MKHRNNIICLSFLALLQLGFVLTASAQDAVPTSTPTGQTTTSHGQQENPELVAALQSAADLFNKTDFNGALERLKEICAGDPKLAPPRIILAQWFARASVADGVRVSLDMATIESPQDPEAYLLLGEIALRQRERAAAALFFERCSVLLQQYNVNPERKKLMQISLFRCLTGLAEIREDWQNMERMIDQRISLEGEKSELFRQKAVAVFRQKRDQDAAALLAKADQLDANVENKPLPAEAILSQLYLQRNDQENAKKFLNAALSKYPNNPDVLAQSINMRMNDGDLNGARQLADKLFAEHPNAPQAKKLVATIALFQQDYATAEKLFQELVVASPMDADSTNGLALSLCEQDDPAKLRRALEYAAENVKKNNRNTDLLGTLGWIFFKANDMKQAGQVFQQAAAQGNLSPQTAFFLARFVNQNGNAEQAKQLLEAALATNRIFAKKQEAQELLNEINKAAPKQ